MRAILRNCYESAERLQAILNTAADAIVTFDRSGTIDGVNLATESLFHFQRDELIGQNISLLVPSILGSHHGGAGAGQLEKDSRTIHRKCPRGTGEAQNRFDISRRPDN